MLTIQLFDNRVDIERTKQGVYNFHCYKFGDNFLYHYRFTNDWVRALQFLLGH